MVTEDNLFLEGALLVYDNVDPTKVTPAEYAAKPSIADGMDVVDLRRLHARRRPAAADVACSYFHPTGEHSPFKVRSELPNPRITEIDEDHPVMRWVTMSDVYTDKSNVFAIDPKKGESSLAYSVRDPIIAAKRDGRRKILAFGFSLPAPIARARPTCRCASRSRCCSSTRSTGSPAIRADLLTTYPTGQRERIPLDGVVGATEADVKGPDGTDHAHAGHRRPRHVLRQRRRLLRRHRARCRASRREHLARGEPRVA